MNKLNNKEEKIKDILGGLEIDIDTNDLWQNIESELPPSKKKRRIGFILLSGLVALLLLGLTWGILSNDDNHVETQTSSNTTSNDKILVQNEKKNSNTQTNLITTQKESSNHLIPTNAANTNIANGTQIKNTIVSNVEITNSKIEESNVVEKNTNFKSTHSILNESKVTDTTHDFVLALNDEILKTESEIAATQDQRDLLLGIDFTPTLSNQLFEITNRKQVETSPNLIQPLSDFGRQLILQVRLGANQNRTSISNLNSIGEFNASEFDFERDRLGFSGSFAIGVENKGWRFLAGISYHQNVSTYERNDVLIVKDPVSGIESYKIASDGTISSQNGTTTITSARDNEISFHRQHRAIDFQATIGKRLWSFKGFVLMADAGFGINTFTESTGYYIDDKAFGFTKISDSTHPYKVNTHWNAIASLELGYDFGKTRIGISPFVRYNPNSITEQTHFYQLKNSQVGMQLSLTYSPTRE